MLVEDDGGSGGTLRFCCRGCHGAYLLIRGAGLGDFYRRRTASEVATTPDYDASYHDGYLSRFVYAADSGSAIDIIIDGIRCASCVWLNEKIIGRLKGVSQVRVNYATGRAKVVFNADEITPARIFMAVARIGYRPRPFTSNTATETARKEQKYLLVRLGTAFFLTMQLMAYSFALYAGYFQSIDQEIKNYLQLFSLLVTTPVIFYCGWPFLSGAWRSVANRAPNMELLIATGALSSYSYSLYATFAGGEVYFETAAMIVTLILAGRLFENAAKRRASAGVERLLGLCAGDTQRVNGEAIETVDPALLRPGDLILVAPGERFPVDGRIAAGSTEVDESPATGEPLPVFKQGGDAIVAGSMNLTGAVRVTCEKEASESFIARVARLVEDAQSRRAPIQGVADKVSAAFVPIVLTLAVITFGWHYLAAGNFSASLMTALAVLLIACPCALGLATPTAILAGTGAAAREGIIFKGGEVLERLSAVKSAVFDKTGTITIGRPELTELFPAPGVPADELVGVAASIERGSRHPVARSICQFAAAKGVAGIAAGDLKEVAGGGVTGSVEGKEVAVGSREFLEGRGVSGMPDFSRAPADAMVIYAARNGGYLGAFILKDTVRHDAPALVDYLKRAGLKTFLLSGDRQQSAAEVAAEVGIDTAKGGISPAGKADEIEKIRMTGGPVLMIGDGINDAPALSAADIGCAIAGGTDIAMDTSELVLVKPDLARLATAHRLARRTMTVVRQNLVWAFLYNGIGIPLAMTGKLTPVYSAAAMALSSLCVVGNSLRLFR
jgi:P-type Cu2+ transporter